MRAAGVGCFFLVGAVTIVLAQSPSVAPGAPSELTIAQVVQDAQQNYPSIHVSEQELNAAVANIRLARTSYLPRLDGIVAVNRATRNNVFGMLLPQNILPGISGPVIGSNDAGSVWGSATGLLFNWQPFDFGLRHAKVESAAAARDRANAFVQRSQLEVSSAAADAFLTVVAAGQARKAAQVAVDNWETLRRSIHALRTAELRPGADESRIDAEKAAASTQLALATEAVEMGEATLSKFLSKPGDVLKPFNHAHFLGDVPLGLEDGGNFHPESTPAMLEQHAVVSQSASELRATDRSWVPQFNLEAAGYGRGSGAETNGQRLSGANGLAPTVGNYAVGLNITFGFLDFASIHAREASQSATLKAEQARETLVGRQLQEQYGQALAALHAMRSVAKNTPIQVVAARTALSQATARYKAGLTSIDDVAQAQRLVVQAEMDDSIARLNVWRVFLQLQSVRGDLQPFLQAAQ
ncbi:TolC family protein [Edaphobacter modestus]|uniref:Outer membrane protein TolC n=1 Tax=Edaphobacter modestus TaxID=388466 RepID=A0A4V2G414_9BACT|nr:TolC family protein [Edaphobacter modestus]RZU39256.1 outer membrane protein TolC [Edaphobacter modestus]